MRLLNAYFDCFVPEIECRGGEVLKYMGDGILAIFRDGDGGAQPAATAALAAGQAGIARAIALSSEKKLARAVKVGVSLHHGAVAYGNIGSGTRLDFTVVGSDVNLASRIQKANKRLDEPLLMSSAFRGDQALAGRDRQLQTFGDCRATEALHSARVTVRRAASQNSKQ